MHVEVKDAEWVDFLHAIADGSLEQLSLPSFEEPNDPSTLGFEVYFIIA